MTQRLSIGSRAFEKVLHFLFPRKEKAKLKRIRRKIYYPILNAWGDYGYNISHDINDDEIDGAKATMTRFVLWVTWRTLRVWFSYLYSS